MSAVNRKFEGLIRGLRPCRIAVGPGKIKTAQTGGAPGQDKRTDDTDRLVA